VHRPGPLSEEGVVRLLDRTGARLDDTEYASFAQELTPEILRQMWHDMMVTRAFDEEATSLQRQGELALWVSSLGQEAAQVGSAYALVDRDYVFPSYREHAVCLKRGIDLAQVPLMWRGIEHSSWAEGEHNTHINTLVIGAHTLHATGFAMGLDRDGKVGSGDPDRDAAAICYFGDGATAQGDTNEALIFASVFNAPVVFFCQNNQWAISLPTTVQSRVPLADRATGVGMPGVRVDGNDVIASYAVTRAAMERARSGGGPTFIEAFTYRMGAHTTSDDPTRYRTSADDDYWRERDPIARLETYLRSIDELPDDFIEQSQEEARQMAIRVRESVRTAQNPEPMSMFDNVYSTPHATVDSERAWYEAYQASFLDSERGSA